MKNRRPRVCRECSFPPRLILATLLLACTSSSAKSWPEPKQKPDAPGRPAGTYNAAKASLQKVRSALQAVAHREPDAALAKARTYLFHAIVDSLAPHWYGTAWDYNGITQVPGQGYIACGYFVTTLLRDAGLPVARVRLVQAPASTLIREVCAANSIKRFTALPALQAYLAAAADKSLFILELDNHVGFITKENGNLYFLDAGYLPPQQVASVPLEKSAPVKMSRTLMVGSVLDNDALLRKWLKPQ